MSTRPDAGPGWFPNLQKESPGKRPLQPQAVKGLLALAAAIGPFAVVLGQLHQREANDRLGDLELRVAEIGDLAGEIRKDVGMIFKVIEDLDRVSVQRDDGVGRTVEALQGQAEALSRQIRNVTKELHQTTLEDETGEAGEGESLDAPDAASMPDATVEPDRGPRGEELAHLIGRIVAPIPPSNFAPPPEVPREVSCEHFSIPKGRGVSFRSLRLRFDNIKERKETFRATIGFGDDDFQENGRFNEAVRVPLNGRPGQFVEVVVEGVHDGTVEGCVRSPS